MQPEDLLTSLNPEQRAAAAHGEGPLLVVAGAGTGKTAVITRRIAHLIATGQAKPTEILALTFTEKAAHEMQDRLYTLIGWQSFSVAIFTFNAFGANILSEYIGHIGRSIKGGLINDIQKTLLLLHHYNDFKFQYYKMQTDKYEFLSGVTSYIGRLQNAGITPLEYRKFVDNLHVNDKYQLADIAEQHDLSMLYSRYQAIKEETSTFDYYDQLALPLEILKLRPNIAARLAQRYHFVLVDEYQDTSPIQDRLLRLLVPAGGNIFAVGDDDQAIYGFRGADIRGVREFSDYFQVERPVTLIQNYRSGQPILDAAYRLISGNNPDRLEIQLGLNKHLIGQNDDANIRYTPMLNSADEQASVIDDVVNLVDDGQKPSSIAILARSNATLRSYAKALRSRNITYSISTSVNIFEQKELLHLWYLMEWIDGRASDETITHVALGPFIGWSAQRWRDVVIRATDDLTTLEDSLRLLAGDGASDALMLIRQLDEWRAWAADEQVGRLAYRLVFEPFENNPSLADKLQNQATGDPDHTTKDSRIIRVFEDLARFFGQLEDYTEVQELSGSDCSLSGYLSQFPSHPSLVATEAIGDEDGVRLLTIHASKGLEFDTVFLVNTTQKAWSEPPTMGLIVPAELLPTDIADPIKEQRRLMYVALTRARRNLYISAPLASLGGQSQKPSIFIQAIMDVEELPTLVLQKQSKLDKTLNKIQHYFPLQQQMPVRLPFETPDGWLELPVGAIESYDRSPHDFYLQYVLKISRPFGPQLSFGSAIHQAIQAFYSASIAHELFTIDDMLFRLDEVWSDRGYQSRDEANTAHDIARDTLHRFMSRESAEPKLILSVEQPITLQISEAKLRLRGRMDATYDLKDGIEVRDFKTGMVRSNERVEEKAKKSPQLRSYALAIEELTGAAPKYVTLDYVVTGAIGRVALSPAILKKHREKLITVAEKIRALEFSPNPPSLFNHEAAHRYYGETEDE